MKTFVEIGIGKFNTLYNLIDNGWKGIMVEALPGILDLYEPKENLYFEELAIDTKVGEARFMKVKDPDWFDNSDEVLGMSGLVGTSNPLYGEGYIGLLEEITVKTITLDMLIDKYELDRIDLLKIDTEGNDIPILMGYSWKILPEMIKFEHAHYSGRDYDYSRLGIDQEKHNQEYVEFIQKLESMGYKVWEETDDVYCIR
jgi:FkbM family methyltransferase